jgi:hypothetical protein
MQFFEPELGEEELVGRYIDIETGKPILKIRRMVGIDNDLSFGIMKAGDPCRYALRAG